MVEYSKVNCKLTNLQLNKLRKAVKSNEEATLRLGTRNFNKDERPHELLVHGSGVKLIIEQKDMKDIMKIIKVLENSGILLKGVSKRIKNETKEHSGGFLSMIFGTLGGGITWQFIKWWRRYYESRRLNSKSR